MGDDHVTITKTQTTDKGSSNGCKKATSSSSQSLQDQPQEALKCPRCDSMNTKFCYYNNYCLSQPRHFCKSCRRYWTKGGSIRNVPIGGGCRKSKKLKASSLNSSRDSTSFDIGRLKLFHGFSSSSSSTIDFQLGGLSIPRLNLSSSPSSGIGCNQVSDLSFGHIDGSSLATQSSCFNLDPSLGFSFSLPPLFKQQSENNVLHDGVGNQDEVFIGNQVAASIESLSSINQDMHWKLQQQRFASMLLGGNDHQHENNVSQGLPTFPIEHHQEIQRPHPISFQNLELSPRTSGGSFGNYSRKERQSSNLATECFLDDTSAPTGDSIRSTTSHGADNGNQNVSWNNGAQAWNNLDQFNALP